MTIKLQNENKSEAERIALAHERIALGHERIALAHEDETPDVVGHRLAMNEKSRVAARLAARGEGEDGEGRIAL
jgi:hypothetical protein